MLIGPYETECIVKTEWPEGPPPEWEWSLFQPQATLPLLRSLHPHSATVACRSDLRAIAAAAAASAANRL